MKNLDNLKFFLTDYVFHNPNIEETPPPRQLKYVEHLGRSTEDINYCLKLTQIRLNEMKPFLSKPLDVPKRLGNWGLMNEWIRNMWEALYNPINTWRNPQRGWGIIKGHHRFRLLDAMEVESFYAYELTAKHYKIGDLNLPPRVTELMKGNDRAPRKGTVNGICETCGKNAKWIHKTFDRVSDVKLYCNHCGAENPHPWRGQI